MFRFYSDKVADAIREHLQHTDECLQFTADVRVTGGEIEITPNNEHESSRYSYESRRLYGEINDEDLCDE